MMRFAICFLASIFIVAPASAEFVPVSEDFILKGKSLHLVTSNSFEPKCINKKMSDGFLTVYDEMELLGQRFVVGIFRSGDQEVGVPGLYSITDGVPRLLVAGDNGILQKKGDILYAAMNEISQHSSLSSLYVIEYEELYDKKYVKKVFVMNGLVTAMTFVDEHLIISGQEFDKPYAAAISFSGSSVNVDILPISKAEQ